MDLSRLRSAFFVGCNALGDTLCTTPVVRAFRAGNPRAQVTYITQSAGYCRVLDGNPDIDLVLYSERLWMHGLADFSLDWFHALPVTIAEPAALFRLDIQAVCAKAESFHAHIATGFSRLLGIPIASVRPVIALTADERRQAGLYTPRPYAVISTQTNSKPSPDSGLGVKEWPADRWPPLVDHLRDVCGLDVISIGAENDPLFPSLLAPSPRVRHLHGLPIKVVAALLESAAVVVSLENGIAHLCAAVNAPAIVLYSNILPRAWADPVDSPRITVLYGDPRALPFSAVCDAVQQQIHHRPQGVYETIVT